MHSLGKRIQLFLIVFLIAFSLSIEIPTCYMYKKEVDKTTKIEFDSYLNLIAQDLNKKYELLLKTENVEAYKEDFLNAIITNFEKVYIDENRCKDFCTLLIKDHKVVVAPKHHKIELTESEINNLYSMKKGVVRTENSQADIFFNFNNTWEIITAYYVPLIYKYKKIREMRTFLLVITTSVLLIFIIISNIFFKNITNSIIKLKLFAEDVASENFNTNLSIKGKNELSILGKTLVTMRDNLKEKINTLVNSREQIKKEIAIREDTEKKLKKAYEELEEKNKDLEEILYIVSHDLRAPIVNIVGFSDLLKDSCTKMSNILKEKIKENKKEFNNIEEYINFIKSSSSHLSRLIDGLLNFMKTGKVSLNKEILDMNQIIKEIIKGATYKIKEKNIEVTIKKLPNCYGDRYYITQLFQNVLNNAIKFGRDGIQSKIEISGKLQNNYSIYTIKDNGIGIDNESQKKIFDLFYKGTNKNDDGLGVGLTIVNRIVKRHNGKIEINSKLNKGTEVIIYLPDKE